MCQETFWALEIQRRVKLITVLSENIQQVDTDNRPGAWGIGEVGSMSEGLGYEGKM
jgi:hypothetical protein